MSDKPTYEELEQRVKELENKASDCKQAEKQTNLGHSRMMSILESIPDGVYIVDKHFNIEYINPVIEKDFGKIQGRKCYQYFHDRAESCPWCKNEEVFAGRSVNWEWYSVKKDRHYELFDTPFGNSDGSISKFEIFHDITDMKQAQETLRKSEEKFRESEGNLRSIFENMQDVYYKLDTNGKILEASPSAVKLYKYDSLDEMIGKQADDFVYNAEDSQKFTEELQRKGYIKSYIIKHKCKNGDPVFVEANTNLIFDDQGNPEGSVGVFRDITERLKAEEALRESETKYRVLFEQMTQGSFRQRADGLLIDANPAALEMFGLTRDEFLGRTSETPVWDVVHEDGVPFHEPEHPSMVALRTGKAVSGVVAGVLNEKTQERVWVEINAIPEFRPGENKPYQAMVTMHDFTESKRAEMLLQREKENLSTTLENNPNGIVLFDNNGKWIYGNPMLTEMTGYTTEDIQTGQEWFQKAYPDADYRKKVIDAWKKDSMQMGKGEVHEFDVTCKDGRVKQIEFSVTHLADRSVSVLTDMTDRIDADMALKESEARLKKAQSVAKLGNWEYDISTGKVWGF